MFVNGGNGPWEDRRIGTSDKPPVILKRRVGNRGRRSQWHIASFAVLNFVLESWMCQPFALFVVGGKYSYDIWGTKATWAGIQNLFQSPRTLPIIIMVPFFFFFLWPLSFLGIFPCPFADGFIPLPRCKLSQVSFTFWLLTASLADPCWVMSYFFFAREPWHKLRPIRSQWCALKIATIWFRDFIKLTINGLDESGSLLIIDLQFSPRRHG